MLIGRVIGWTLLILAAMVVGLDLLRLYVSSQFTPTSTRELWSLFSPNSLQLAQTALPLHAPWLWDPVLVAILPWPAELVLAVPGLFLVWTCRMRERRGRRR
jgi:hypothetical protein